MELVHTRLATRASPTRNGHPQRRTGAYGQPPYAKGAFQPQVARPTKVPPFLLETSLRRSTDTAMQYITILGRTSEVNDASYTDKRSGEIVPRTELLLEIPGLRDKVRCELPQTASIPQADLERWELEESWVVVEASSFRQMAFARSNARPGESAFGAMLAFQAATVREATADERRIWPRHVVRRRSAPRSSAPSGRRSARPSRPLLASPPSQLA